MAAPVRAVVFDFDGLVLDTEVPIYRSWCEVFEEHGCAPPTLEEWARELGTQRGLDVVGLLAERAGRPVEEQAVQASRRARRDELLAREPARPGVVQWLDDAARLGFGTAIASSSEEEWVHRHLTRLGLRHRFAHLSCWGERLAPKPAPDTYLAACKCLGVAPEQALAVEDSPNGIAAARAAGLRVVAVPNDLTAKLDLSAADVVIGSLAGHHVTEIIATIGG